MIRKTCSPTRFNSKLLKGHLVTCTPITAVLSSILLRPCPILKRSFTQASLKYKTTLTISLITIAYSDNKTFFFFNIIVISKTVLSFFSSRILCISRRQRPRKITTSTFHPHSPIRSRSRWDNDRNLPFFFFFSSLSLEDT